MSPPGGPQEIGQASTTPWASDLQRFKDSTGIDLLSVEDFKIDDISSIISQLEDRRVTKSFDNTQKQELRKICLPILAASKASVLPSSLEQRTQASYAVEPKSHECLMNQQRKKILSKLLSQRSNPYSRYTWFTFILYVL